MSADDSLPPKGNVYDLVEDTIPAPPMPGDAVVAPDLDRLIDKLAADLVIHAENCVREFGDFHLVLTGGTTPLPIYERLMYDPNYRRLPWKRTHLWLAWESSTDDTPAFRTISETIVDHAGIPPEQVHPIDIGAASAASDYETALTEALSWREKGQDRLDYVLLVPDTEGCAPGLVSVFDQTSRLVHSEPGPSHQPDAVTVALTATFVNSARFVAMLLTGNDYASLVNHISTGARKPPILRIHPINGELTWYMDAKAIG